jgi:hypothetical protein
VLHPIPPRALLIGALVFGALVPAAPAAEPMYGVVATTGASDNSIFDTGLRATTVNVFSVGQPAGKGLGAMPWLGGYNNETHPTKPCQFAQDNAWVADKIDAIEAEPAENAAVVAWHIADEPHVSACPDAVDQFRDRYQAIHAADDGTGSPAADRPVVLSHFTEDDYGPLYGDLGSGDETADVLGIVKYPCAERTGTDGCLWSELEHEIEAAKEVGWPATRLAGWVQAFGQVKLATGTTTSGSNQVAGVSPNAGIKLGHKVSGPGIQPGTTVTAISGSTLTLSLNATAAGTSTLTFTPSGGFYYTAPSSAEFTEIVNRFRWHGIDDLWLYTWDETGSAGDIGLSAFTDPNHIQYSSALTAAVSQLKPGLCEIELDQPEVGEVLDGTGETLDVNVTASTVSKVEYFVDGVEVAEDATSPTWDEAWDTTTVSDGAHEFAAQATCTDGVFMTKAQTNQVDNVP